MAAGTLLCALAGATSRAQAIDFGRLTGTVSDTDGNPLMGATVMLTGPQLGAREALGAVIERVTTDARGRFTIEDLAPGWYSLRVVSATRVPALRDKIRVAAGETTRQKFVLSDFFSPLRLQNAKPDFSTWDDDWKWILRTSDSTRPVLRFRRAEVESKGQQKVHLPGEVRVFGVTPGSLHEDTMSEEPGMGSVVAYLRPLSPGSDLLVAGSLDALGLQGSAFVASFRKNLISGDPEELSLTVHNLNFDGDGLPPAAEADGGRFGSAQGVVVSFVHTRRLSKSLTLTTGLEADYLNARGAAEILRPQLAADYQVSSATKVAFIYGPPPARRDGAVLDRVDTLSRFPRVSLQGSHPQLENVQHMEVAVQHRVGRNSRAGFAVYRDSVRNAAVWGAGQMNGSASAEADLLLLPNGEGNGVALNAGSYTGTGFRADYERQLGEYFEIAIAYAYGDALAPAGGMANSSEVGTLRATQIANYLRSQGTGEFSGRISARVPSCHTQIVTSYAWLPSGRVTVVDPYGMASMDFTPFLSVQIRQPLPTVAFLPAHFEALADFRNLLGQGSVAVAESDGNPVLLTSAYRTLRGGFSVRF
jgi:Carboxypeptidase regulatory-like domain